jgi:hypothetical protein
MGLTGVKFIIASGLCFACVGLSGTPTQRLGPVVAWNSRMTDYPAAQRMPR